MNAKSASGNILIKTVPLVLLKDIRSIVSDHLKIEILAFYEIIVKFF